MTAESEAPGVLLIRAVGIDMSMGQRCRRGRVELSDAWHDRRQNSRRVRQPETDVGEVRVGRLDHIDVVPAMAGWIAIRTLALRAASQIPTNRCSAACG